MLDMQPFQPIAENQASFAKCLLNWSHFMATSGAVNDLIFQILSGWRNAFWSTASGPRSTTLFNSQEICCCTDFNDAVEALELLRPRLDRLKEELPCLLGVGSELQILVKRCNVYHLIEDIFLLGTELDKLDSIDNCTEPRVQLRRSTWRRWARDLCVSPKAKMIRLESLVCIQDRYRDKRRPLVPRGSAQDQISKLPPHYCQRPGQASSACDIPLAHQCNLE